MSPTTTGRTEDGGRHPSHPEEDNFKAKEPETAKSNGIINHFNWLDHSLSEGKIPNF
jgi:hypothetical protein